MEPLETQVASPTNTFAANPSASVEAAAREDAHRSTGTNRTPSRLEAKSENENNGGIMCDAHHCLHLDRQLR